MKETQTECKVHLSRIMDLTVRLPSAVLGVISNVYSDEQQSEDCSCNKQWCYVEV